MMFVFQLTHNKPKLANMDGAMSEQSSRRTSNAVATSQSKCVTDSVTPAYTYAAPTYELVTSFPSHLLVTTLPAQQGK